jgi:hypothetical protein
MAQIIPIELEDGTLIYIEAQEQKQSKLDPKLDPKRSINTPDPEPLPQKFKAIEQTVRAYTTYTLGAFKGLAIAEISEVNLEFGVKINATSGVPFIASGTGECNVKISVKCTFPKLAP